LIPKYNWYIDNFIVIDFFSDNITPRGRIGDGIIRDNKFTINFDLHLNKLLLEYTLENIMFINYTGHCSSFSSCLLSRNIDCIWQIPYRAIKQSYDNKINNRLLSQLQDSVNSTLYQFPPLDKKINSFGIVLEAPHELSSTIEISKLPSSKLLKKLGIQKVVIFTENKYPFKSYNLYDTKFYEEELINYFEELKKNLDIIIIGGDYL
jgi:hypothetical protein